MSFCIECGAKAPDVAKFCPQCGVALVEVEISQANDHETGQAKTEKSTEVDGSELDLSTETTSPSEEITLDNPADAAPSVSESLAASANAAGDTPKSKAGLVIGVGILALLVLGGGAYATGLFSGGDKDVTQSVSAPTISTAAPVAENEPAQPDASGTNIVLAAYQEAIRTGRISDLGQFAKDNPQSSLSKDAELAALASLNRQKSVLAYSTFVSFFPNADTSSYNGPRSNEDVDETADTPVLNDVEASLQAVPSIRESIQQRSDDLAPFISQGDAAYAVAVIDDMLSLADLNEAEATYLLNLRSKAETSIGFAAPSTPEVILSEPEQALNIQPAALDTMSQPTIPEPASIDSDTSIKTEATVELTPTAEMPPEAETELTIDPPAPELVPELLYDTPAKPIERFGAITPDAATEPGECDMTFSVDTLGSPTNITAACTDPIFIVPAKETVSDWSYSPATLNDEPIQQDGIVVKIKFHLE